MYYFYVAIRILVIKTELLIYRTKVAICNLYNNILVKSTNQFYSVDSGNIIKSLSSTLSPGNDKLEYNFSSLNPDPKFIVFY